jgi:hypothetical protein
MIAGGSIEILKNRIAEGIFGRSFSQRGGWPVSCEKNPPLGRAFRWSLQPRYQVPQTTVASSSPSACDRGGKPKVNKAISAINSARLMMNDLRRGICTPGV